jgi:teichuronic acid biosynthesis glycosyltransferase TuaG
MDKVSVVIPTYNRFTYLLNTIKSVKEQTYSNIEIIVVNDKSTQNEYYNYNWETNNIKIINLEKNSKEIFGYACAGFVRNKGIE